MYPEWWGDGECVEVGAKPRPQNRPAPRLAYGAATKPPPQKVPVEDDLVTAAYLGVPSSGYGKTKTKPVSHAKEAIAARREQLRRRKREALVEATSRRAARDRGDRADADREGKRCSPLLMLLSIASLRLSNFVVRLSTPIASNGHSCFDRGYPSARGPP